MYQPGLHHLIPEDSDGAGGGHLLRPEPDRGDPGRHAQDKDLRERAAELSQEGDREQVGPDAGHLDPRPRAVERRGHESHDPEPLSVQQPGHREDERDVRQHVDHGHPVYSEGVHLVEIHENVADDAVLDPLVGVAQRVGAEEEHDQPAPAVQAGGRGFEAGLQGLIAGERLAVLRLHRDMVVLQDLLTLLLVVSRRWFLDHV